MIYPYMDTLDLLRYLKMLMGDISREMIATGRDPWDDPQWMFGPHRWSMADG